MGKNTSTYILTYLNVPILFTYFQQNLNSIVWRHVNGWVFCSLMSSYGYQRHVCRYQLLLMVTCDGNGSPTTLGSQPVCFDNGLWPVPLGFVWMPVLFCHQWLVLYPPCVSGRFNGRCHKQWVSCDDLQHCFCRTGSQGFSISGSSGNWLVWNKYRSLSSDTCHPRRIITHTDLPHCHQCFMTHGLSKLCCTAGIVIFTLLTH